MKMDLKWKISNFLSYTKWIVSKSINKKESKHANIQ